MHVRIAPEAGEAARRASCECDKAVHRFASLVSRVTRTGIFFSASVSFDTLG